MLPYPQSKLEYQQGYVTSSVLLQLACDSSQTWNKWQYLSFNMEWCYVKALSQGD